MKNIDITKFIKELLPVDSFPFNPSIAHITGDTYLVSVRSFTAKRGEPIPDERNNSKNPQHPWSTKWKGDEDATYVFPVVLVEDSIQPLRQDIYPLKIDAQDARIFQFCQTETNAAFILTYNKEYSNRADLLIKGGDRCDDYCYIIDWSYLVLDINTLEYSHMPSTNPLCLNISNQVEKNWSLWMLVENPENIYLILSYALTPVHTAFSFVIQGAHDGRIEASSLCKMLTQRPKSQGDFLESLELYHNKQLYVSLSTPSYLVGDVYQAIGHIKVRIEYLKGAPKGGLKKFKRLTNSAMIHPTFVYFMFIYQFKVAKMVFSETPEENVSHAIELTPTKRFNVELVKISPAFIVEKDYLLNFPSGQVVLPNGDTLISYGNGDRESHLLRLTKEEVNDMLMDVQELKPQGMKFIFLK